MTFVAWATLVAAVVAAGGSVFGAVLQRRTGRESAAVSLVAASGVERRAHREELMGDFRWAAELAVRSDRRESGLGVAVLDVLSRAKLLDDEMQPLVDAAVAVVVDREADAVEDVAGRGASVEVVEVSTESSRPGEAEGGLQSDGETGPEGAT